MAGVTHGDIVQITPDAVAASLARGDGGFGRNQRSYYDHPVLRGAHWRWEIIWYFYIGGLMSGSAILAAAADTFGAEGDEAVVRNGRWLALVGAAISPLLLIKDLGRPERFLNMTRILKLKSPMSVGVWSLLSFSGLSAIAVLEELRGRGRVPWLLGGLLPRGPRNLAHALAAAFTGSYTGVLISATAVPVWNSGRRQIPAIFVCSAVATACAAQAALLALRGGSARSINKLERIEFVASLTEGVLLVDYASSAGETGNALFGGETGQRLRANTLVGGIAVPALLNLASLFTKPSHAGKPNVVKTLIAAGLTLYGGYVLRKSLIEAGRASADDPRAALRQPE
ncbi:hypothetical protein EPN52_02555 [bacterium]|nr:MAG: hypothetical protein EPN52_02555 [bacterium]